MPGTVAGGRKARETNYKKHGADFYKRIGTVGGRNGHTGGFAANQALASVAGRIGGMRSRRGKAVNIYPRVPSMLTDEEWGRIADMRDERMPWTEIGNFFGVNPISLVGTYNKRGSDD